MPRYLYLDIETIPCQDPDKAVELVANAEPPGNMKKPETIQKWRDEGAGDIVAKTSFNGGLGHICHIAAVLPDYKGTPFVGSVAQVKAEKQILEMFAHAIKLGHGDTIPVIVGHNINNFDIRFIWQRAIALGVKLPNWFPRDPKPWSNETFDTMTAWAGSRGYVSLDDLASYLGLEGKQGIDGSMVAGVWAEGKHQEIADYCMADVQLTKAIHEKMLEAGI